MARREPFYWVSVSCGIVVLAFILLPLVEMLTAPSSAMLKETLHDKNVVQSIWLSVYTAFAAAGISFVVGTPLAYVLARSRFRGKHLIESIIDLPIVIPHPVVGIAILGVAGRNHWLGQIMSELGIRIMGTTMGIIAVLTFVGMPFYINALKSGIEAVSPRLENVSRSLGASMWGTFARITFPLAWRSVLVGIIMCCARAISEFGAVVVVAYHPMIAPVLIYERYEAYGLKYSQPVAVWLVLVCLTLFLVLRVLALPGKKTA
ncbi:MAG TPA: ABC transporter permease [Deltaproteobacteria bacterium]|jgi:molybdate/tungstate transport system permease protein|nr:MAG: Sulfate transport system permease protein CysT [Deltaproteobacteria bacterium ADurb.Bin072]HOC74639.1 ABC transporter permease [Deltaproteobacteria bacterium]HRW80890.1 ABC transporter permease [Desulfomonilia bacterium]HON96076.1 ABC transporter permease [Deltaproteobacteria bacterium]HOY73925.1 ABC transporter permease [Deltaproteobacteria bacterium]